MRLAKMFSLIALAALVMMTVVGATSASGSKPTQLCNLQHSGAGETCSSAANSVHTINIGVVQLLTDLVDVLCLHTLMTASVGALAIAGARQTITPSALLFGNCGTVAAHSNCLLTVEVLPKLLLLRTALNLGNFKIDGGTIRVKCQLFPFPVEIDCTYGFNTGYEAPVEGALHTASAGHGMITLANAPALKTAGGALCPNSSTLDALLEPLSHVFITS